jgi:hypothetical protein
MDNKGVKVAKICCARLLTAKWRGKETPSDVQQQHRVRFTPDSIGI